MSSTPSKKRIVLFVLASGVISLTYGSFMLLVDGFSNATGYFIGPGVLLTFLGLRARAKARRESESGAPNRST